MNDIQQTITEKTESTVAAVKSTVAAVEAVATDAAEEAKSKAEALRADGRALSDKTRRYAQEIWSDVQSLARGGFAYAREALVELRGKLTFKRASTESVTADSTNENASSNAA